jgi:hypothetical protein
MLDCPLQIHTSPTTTLVKVTALAPVSVAVKFPPVAFATMLATLSISQTPRGGRNLGSGSRRSFWMAQEFGWGMKFESTGK